ncbi:class I SAM-dependent RNA methyltransferase [Gordonia liuliyuniae]|uniref:Class I SAM-dependent RNA methyltransferase n=1 Tax=Gordonia liuliyuniae TaxID=2911517 RepID=A0ABS9IR96_9ACTN|nr:TRAM domain-containing protein [Gordonia liuliyuniae]MCF8588079.1 class I SAM-dependent RNA methyltransferase [Gordonia liuliyuniae]
MADLDLDVTGYANGGAGVARHDGRVVFVTGALPGERVRARIVDDRKASFARAAVVEVLDASEHRVDEQCRAAAAGAGCCDLSFVDADYARELGAVALSDVLTRIGRFSSDGLEAPTVAALGDEVTGWRVRTRLAVAADGTVGLRGRKSAELVTVPCAAPVAGLLDGIAELGGAAGTELVLAVGSDGRRHIAELSAPTHAGGRGKDRRGRAQRARSARSAPRTVRTVEGRPHVEYTVGKRTWSIPVTGFWQAHRNAPDVYSATAVDLLETVGVTGDVHLWDLYGGAGVFTAALCDADGGFTVTGSDIVDTDPGALAAADRVLAGEPAVTHRGQVAATIADLTDPDVVVSDPPRSGAGADVVDAIVAASPSAVVHVGCDAAAFARDLGRFAAQGYRVRAWQGFAAFPMTHHVEGMAVLTQ